EQAVNFNLAGTTVQIFYNTTDGNFAMRKKALETALGLIQPKLTVPIPAFDAYFPKFSWTLSKSTGSKGDILIHAREVGSRAEFYLPNTILLTMGAMDSKVTTSVSAEIYKKAAKD